MDRLPELCRDRDIVIVPFRERGDRWGHYVVVDGKEHLTVGRKKAVQDAIRTCRQAHCWDLRELEESGIEVPSGDVIDWQAVRGARELGRSLEPIGPPFRKQYTEDGGRHTAHLRACRAAGIDLKEHSLLIAVPPEVVRGALWSRAVATIQLAEAPIPDDPGAPERWSAGEWEEALALRGMERDGTFVDRDHAAELLKRTDLLPGTARFLRSAVQLADGDGIARYCFGMNATRTGRYNQLGGLGVMGIPHGPARSVIRSRHARGTIVSLDFNAIDYRCIVASTDDPDLQAYYEGHPDFHRRTAQMFFADPDDVQRRVIKYSTYVFLYGGSRRTLIKKTGLSEENIQKVIERLERKLGPVARLRDRLAAEGRRNRFVTTPGGRRITVRPEDHDGAILGLYAQTYSSEVFGRALVSAYGRFVERKSKLMFPVHDELVIDVHPNEVDLVGESMALMARPRGMAGPRFVVNMKEGETYADCDK